MGTVRPSSDVGVLEKIATACADLDARVFPASV
jgi:hypothetical protein